MLSLPERLLQAIETEMDRFGWHDMVDARKELTERYRSPHKQHLITKDEHRWAYIAARLPATYAVVHRVLKEAALRTPGIAVKTLLDLGSGPGTAAWAAVDVFPQLEKMTLVEKDIHLMDLGKRLAGTSDHRAVLTADWQVADLEKLSTLPPHDLITLSYSVGELPEKVIFPLIEACWQATNQFLVVIEPGTPVGFERIRAIRRRLIELKAWIVAPCPHALTCPMADGDWCHFSERVERSSLHRRIKEGQLGYEDEKYSYIAVSKSPAILPKSRVLRHPMRRSGHVNLTLCTPEGLKQETISKKQGQAYKQARKSEWGSPFPDDEEHLGCS